MDTKILHSELNFRTSRSSGSGGQHVNKVESRVELLFDIPASQFLSAAQKTILLERLASRLTKDGLLIIARQDYRSQQRNREAAIAAFDEVLQQALRPRKTGKGHQARIANPEGRLKKKKLHAEKKALRGKVRW